MADKTGIQWTDATWNPVRGCSRISPGCEHCYAETMASRFTKPGQAFHGFAVDGRWTRKVELVEKMLDTPTHWKKPRRIFVNSMSDLFHESLPWLAIGEVFAVMEKCPQHTFQILTKRAERMREFMRVEYATEPPPANVWLGVSVEDQKRADERIPHLLATSASVRFLSVEPLLGPVDLSRWMPSFDAPITDGIPLPTCDWGDCDAETVAYRQDVGGHGWLPVCAAHRGIAWAIVGGESGSGARPMRLEWARHVVAQCRNAGVSAFVKQLGGAGDKRDNPAEWPADLRVREFPDVR